MRSRATLEELEKLLEVERTQLPPWIAVGLGSGIVAWFALGEPGDWAAFLCISSALALLGFALPPGRASRALGWFALSAALGCALIWVRSQWVAAPRLDRPKVTEVTGRVEAVDHLAAKGALRLLIWTSDPALPPRVRVSIDREGAPDGLARGAVLSVRARLVMPPPMTLPGSYDFSRDAWFKQIGAVGTAMGEVAVLEPAQARGLDGARQSLREHIARSLPERSAGIAIALATGDQNSVAEEDAEAMRRSGLTHLLSVSGLHIAAVVAATMFLCLKILALSEWLALRFNLVLASAFAAAATGVGYTLLTGAQVPTVRSCVAALLVLAGIALGREAISIRLIAVGALAVMLLWPEAVAGASFQMSFAAVTAIVALHSTGSARRWLERRDEGLLRRAGRALLGMVLTGLAVELALIPFALFHFHRAGLYSVAANIIAIPLTTFIIMPLESGALLLDTIGVGAPLWALTGIALDALLGLAHVVASTSGSIMMLPAIPGWAFGLMVAGGIWACLWNSRLRLLGFAPALLGAVAAVMTPRPDILITGDGRHLAVIDEGVPLLLREGAGDYMRGLFSEASAFDGDPAALASRSFTDCSRDACVAILSNGASQWRLLATRSPHRIDWTALNRACAEADIVVSSRWLPRGCTPRWLKLDRKSLEQTGGVSLYLDDPPSAATVADRVGRHPWAS